MTASPPPRWFLDRGSAGTASPEEASLPLHTSYSPFRIWGFIYPACGTVQHLAPFSKSEPPSQVPAQRQIALTVGDLHLVGRRSPLHPIAAVHRERVRFTEEAAANEKAREAMRTRRHPPGLARPPRKGSARSRREVELLRDHGKS